MLSLGLIYRLRSKLLKAQLELVKVKASDKNNAVANQAKQQKTPQNMTASAAKTRYLSGISHELRTPLNVIMGYAQLLEKQATAEDPNKDKYALMRHNCEHLNHLIEGILEFSAIEAGKLKVQFEVVDLQDLINQLTTMFNHQCEQKGLTFISQIDPKLPKLVKTDHKRLQQILINLLSNAIKFTSVGQVEFTVSYRNQVATFTIKDSGRGIEAADLERIFEPFERIEQADKPIKGTGLGLSITRLLVDLLGGELTVKSQINSGSHFSVKMMLAPLTGLNTLSATQHDNEINFNPATKNHQQAIALQHILVVDDKKSHRQLLTEILQTKQFKLSTAADAKQAQRLIKELNFALAIIDVAMPEMDGWQLATWLRANSPTTKILMLSANPRDVEASLNNPYDVYLTKPIKINQLMSDINHLLNLGWQTSQQTQVQNNPADAIKLPAEHRSALINMLEIGHINGIENYLNQLVEKQIINQHQHQQLTQPVKAMNLNAFKKIIEDEH